MERIAIYPGSFDPATNGHMWMIKQGSQLFDHLVVSVSINSKKDTNFTLEERMDMLEEITERFPNVSVSSSNRSLLVDFAARVGAKYILRGIRSKDDYGFEEGMNFVNKEFLNPNIISVYLMPPYILGRVSSSVVRELVQFENWQERVRRLVPRPVYEKILEKYG